MNESYALIKHLVHQKACNIHYEISHEDKVSIEHQLSGIIANVDLIPVLSTYGIHSDQGFLSDLEYRLLHYFFSETFDRHDLGTKLSRADPQNQLKNILEQTTPKDFVSFLQWCINKHTPAHLKILDQIKTVLSILSSRLAHHGSNWRVWERLQEYPGSQSIFLDIQRSIQSFLDQPHQAHYEALSKKLSQGLQAWVFLRAQSAKKGISLSLTTRLSIIFDLIARIDQLVAILYHPPSNRLFQTKLHQLSHQILVAKSDKLKFSALFRNFFGLVSLEITDFASSAGKKYVNNSKKGFIIMLKKGLIGGLMVGVFSLLKPLFGEMDLAPMMVFTKSAVIYSFIFLAIYFCKGTLATKQPAMTASHLAKTIDTINDSKKPVQELASLIQSTFRNQLIALFGNIVLALPLAALTYVTLNQIGINLLDNKTASYLMTGLHPFKTASLFYAALTGVCLAISGFMAGAANNWLVFHQIPERLLRKNTLKDQESSLKHVSLFLDKHFTGIVSNVSLAFMLGFLPFLGFIFRLPIDIRHITFASANVGTSIAHKGFNINAGDLSVYLLGVLLIGLINLSVSFSLTFLVALKSRQINLSFRTYSFKTLALHLFRRPWRFLLPM